MDEEIHDVRSGLGDARSIQRTGHGAANVRNMGDAANLADPTDLSMLRDNEAVQDLNRNRDRAKKVMGVAEEAYRTAAAIAPDVAKLFGGGSPLGGARVAGPDKAFLLTEKGDRIEFLFNPAQLVIEKRNTWQAAQSKGRNSSALRFQAGQPGTLTMEILLDTTAQGTDVTAHTSKLIDLMKVDMGLAGADRGRNNGRPPWVEFHWGKLHSFKAIVESLRITFTYFASSGMPLRAKANVSLKQYNDEEFRPLQNPTSHTPTLHSVHRVVHGETLDRIAASHYADPFNWRLIAEANGIVDPMALEPGTVLSIPELPVRRRA